jgi:hypothetical protein
VVQRFVVLLQGPTTAKHERDEPVVLVQGPTGSFAPALHNPKPLTLAVLVQGPTGSCAVLNKESWKHQRPDHDDDGITDPTMTQLMLDHDSTHAAPCCPQPSHLLTEALQPPVLHDLQHSATAAKGW